MQAHIIGVSSSAAHTFFKRTKSQITLLAGLRNPCVQLDQFQPGLMSAVPDRAPDGKLVRKAGVMGVVITGSTVGTGDVINVSLPAESHQALVPV